MKHLVETKKAHLRLNEPFLVSNHSSMTALCKPK